MEANRNTEVSALLVAARTAMRWAQTDMPATGYKAIERHAAIDQILQLSERLSVTQSMDDIWRADGQPDDQRNINDATQARIAFEDCNP